MALTAKDLQPLAEGLADMAQFFGADEEETVDRALYLAERLVARGAITPRFKRNLFITAVRNAYRGV